MHVASQSQRLQTLKQLGSEIEVRLVNEVAFGLEGIAAVAHTIENGARLQSIEELVAIGIHQKVEDHGVLLGHALQAPGRGVKDSAGHIIAKSEQGAQQVRAEEAAGAKHQDRPLQAANLLFQARVGHGVLPSSLRMEAGSRPDSCRW